MLTRPWDMFQWTKVVRGDLVNVEDVGGTPAFGRCLAIFPISERFSYYVLTNRTDTRQMCLGQDGGHAREHCSRRLFNHLLTLNHWICLMIHQDMLQTCEQT